MNDVRGALVVLGHFTVLPLMAIAIVLILVSEDVLVRLGGIIALVFLEQIRDMWVVRELTSRRKKP